MKKKICILILIIISAISPDASGYEFEPNSSYLNGDATISGTFFWSNHVKAILHVLDEPEYNPVTGGNEYMLCWFGNSIAFYSDGTEFFDFEIVSSFDPINEVFENVNIELNYSNTVEIDFFLIFQKLCRIMPLVQHSYIQVLALEDTIVSCLVEISPLIKPLGR